MYWDTFIWAAQLCEVPDSIWSPTFLQASSEFVRGLITSSTWLTWITLPASDNFEYGRCILSQIGSIGV